MPKSRVRKRAVYTPPAPPSKKLASPPWLAPAMVTCFLLGIIWLVAYYLVGTDAPPWRDLAAGANLGIGFGLILVGFVLSTRWR